VFAAFSTYEHGGTRTPAPQDRNLMLYPLNHVPSFENTIITYFAKIKPPILGVAEYKYDNRSKRSLEPVLGAMSCRFFYISDRRYKTAAVLSVFLFGGNLRIKPPLHELPLPQVSYLNSATPLFLCQRWMASLSDVYSRWRPNYLQNLYDQGRRRKYKA
jgi:hypothetical protein